MKTVTRYETIDGRTFADPAQAQNHEALLAAIKQVMSVLPERPKNIDDGWLQHTKEQVLQAKRGLIKLVEPLVPESSFPQVAAAIRNYPDSIHPMSIVERIIDDSDSPIVYAWKRLCCIDDKFREHNQPYFAINGPDKKHKQLN